MNLYKKFENYFDKKTKNITEKEENILFIGIISIILLLLLFSFLISKIVGVIHLIYYMVVYYVVENDILDDKYLVVFLFPITLTMLLISNIYYIITPYRGDDMKIKRKIKLKKLKRQKLFNFLKIKL